MRKFVSLLCACVLGLLTVFASPGAHAELSTSILFGSDPSPTTTDPFDYSATPLPQPVSTPLPSLSPTRVAYNYYTRYYGYPVQNLNYFNRNNSLTDNPPPFIDSSFVSSSMRFPVNFSYQNSLVQSPGLDVVYDAACHVLSFGFDFLPRSYDDTFYATFDLSNLYFAQALPSTDLPQYYTGSVTVAVRTLSSLNQLNSVFDYYEYHIDSASLSIPYSVSIPLSSYNGAATVSFYFYSENFMLRSEEYPNGIPYYASCSSVNVSFASSQAVLPVSPSDSISVDVGNSLFEQTTAIGRFFGWLWQLLSGSFADLIEFLRGAFSALTENLFSWVGSIMRSVANGHSQIVSAINSQGANIVSSVDTQGSNIVTAVTTQGVRIYDNITTWGRGIVNKIETWGSGIVQAITTWCTGIVNKIEIWGRGIVQAINNWGQQLYNLIVSSFADLISFLRSLFVPSADDLSAFVDRIRLAVTPEDGSTMSFPHQIEMRLFDILASDYSTAPTVSLREFSMDLGGRSYVIFPSMIISADDVFPPAVLVWVHRFGDLGLAVLTYTFLRRKVRMLLDLKYSED